MVADRRRWLSAAVGVGLGVGLGTPSALAAGSQPGRPALTPDQQRAIDELTEAIEERARRNARFAELERDYAAAFNQRDWERARAVITEQIRVQPGSFVPYYNLAAVQAIDGDRAAAMESLVIAVERGFDNAHQLRHDPHLDAIRGEPAFANLLAAWPRVLELGREANRRAVSEFYAAGYLDLDDEEARLLFRSGYDAGTTESARLETRRVADWATHTLFPDLFDADAAADDPWVAVVLPTDRDYTRWQVREFGPRAVGGGAAVGGLYDHDRKRLVVRDLGATLRHEVMHVYHWRDMMRRGQRHPTWIQEGLAALVEDMDPPATEDGTRWVAAPSWRTNTARRLAELGRLTSIGELAAMTPREFGERRPLAVYAEVRTFFMWLDARGELAQWYRDYTANFGADPTGLESVRRVTGLGVDELDSAFSEWVRALPEVPETGRDLRGTLGLDVEGGSGDGPVVVGFREARVRREVELRIGDVIRSLDGRPVRDLQELIRVLASFEPGDTIAVTFRRGAEHRESSVTVRRR